MAATTRARVSSATFGSRLITRETVVTATPGNGRDVLHGGACHPAIPHRDTRRLVAPVIAERTSS